MAAHRARVAIPRLIGVEFPRASDRGGNREKDRLRSCRRSRPRCAHRCPCRRRQPRGRHGCQTTPASTACNAAPGTAACAAHSSKRKTTRITAMSTRSTSTRPSSTVRAANATIQLATGVTSLEAVDLGLNCALEKPCVGIEGPPIGYAVGIGNGPLRVSGLAIFDSPTGLLTDVTTDDLELSNSWLGLRLNGNAAGNGNGLFAQRLKSSDRRRGPEARMSSPETRSASGSSAPTTRGAGQPLRRQGKRRPRSQYRSRRQGQRQRGFQTENILIGAEPDATPECDGACNVIAAGAGASGQGIDLAEDIDGNPAATDVQVIGNHIGVRAGGDTPIGDAGELVPRRRGRRRDDRRNRLAGGVQGIEEPSARRTSWSRRTRSA